MVVGGELRFHEREVAGGLSGRHVGGDGAQVIARGVGAGGGGGDESGLDGGAGGGRSVVREGGELGTKIEDGRAVLLAYGLVSGVEVGDGGGWRGGEFKLAAQPAEFIKAGLARQWGWGEGAGEGLGADSDEEGGDQEKSDAVHGCGWVPGSLCG